MPSKGPTFKIKRFRMTNRRCLYSIDSSRQQEKKGAAYFRIFSLPPYGEHEFHGWETSPATREFPEAFEFDESERGPKEDTLGGRLTGFHYLRPTFYFTFGLPWSCKVRCPNGACAIRSFPIFFRFLVVRSRNATSTFLF